MIKAVIFDLDDTIISSNKHIQEGLVLVFTKTKKWLGGITLDKFLEANRRAADSLLQAKNLTLQQFGFLIWYETLNNLKVKSNPALVFTCYQTLQDYILGHIRLEPGILRVLTFLRKNNYKIAILSNGSFLERMRKLEKLKLLEKIDLLVSSDLIGKDKPNPQPFETTLKMLGIAHNEAVYVGDSFDEDVLGAKEAGILPILYSKGNNEIIRNKISDVMIINRHTDLIMILDSLGKKK